MPTAEGKLPPSGGGESRCSPAGTKGDRTPYGFLSPLDSPYLPLRCDSLRSRSEMRGAHSDVWCSKGTPLMEAELFAAERGRPAQNGRALVCAANHASEIQGSSATYKLKNARNRAPFLPFRRATEGSRVLRKMRGSQEGDKKPFGVLSPFCPRRRAAAFPPVNTGISAARRRQFPPAVGTAINQRSGPSRSFAFSAHFRLFSAAFTSCICKSWSRSALLCSYRSGRMRSRSRPWQHLFRPPTRLPSRNKRPPGHR